MQRVTEIRPPSVAAETLNVLKAAAVIVLLVAAYLLARASVRPGPNVAQGFSPASPADFLPFQSLIADAPSADQRMFRELQEGLLEAQRIRSESRQWPEPSTLAAEDIPPFAADPARKNISYQWSKVAQGGTINYLGVPSAAAAPAWLLVILEPEPGAPPDPAPNDETHHRLLDGTTLHVSIWRTPESARRSGFNATAAPQNEGWQQLLIGGPPPATRANPGTGPLKIGVTLHPYYSWTSNVVAGLPGYEVVPILPGEIDAGDYQPRPEDIKKLADLDAIVVNGIGHDDFIAPMIKASGNTHLAIIQANAETAQIHSAHGTAPNSHTFISFTSAIQQTYAIEQALAVLRPADAAALQRNAAIYARRLRQMRGDAAATLAGAKVTRVVTVHDGYGYLLQEFGLEVAGVVQPAHGLTPSAAELRDMIQLLQREHIKVVFSEESFPPQLLKVLEDEAGVKVYIITHIASGAYTPEKFEREMQRNVDTMIRALVTEE